MNQIGTVLRPKLVLLYVDTTLLKLLGNLSTN